MQLLNVLFLLLLFKNHFNQITFLRENTLRVLNKLIVFLQATMPGGVEF